MKNAITYANLAGEARLLYVLLDALDCSGLVQDLTFRERMREAKRRSETIGFEEEAEASFMLLAELERNGAMSGTWIQQRWLTLKGRVEGA